MNKLLTFNKVKDITQGQWITKPNNPDLILRGGAFDTRALGEADIFFTWEGENSDGHKHIHQLAKSDIKLIIVEKEVPTIWDKPILKVKNSLRALHLLAKELMKGFCGKTVNITGSSGKTTTKSWLQHILSDHRNLLTNIGSFNNHIGCPITILNLKEDHNLLVLEMGTSGIGEIERLTAIAPADIALLLNVGHAHLGMIGSRENIYQAKLELFSHLKPDAISLLPAFDERLVHAQVKGEKHFFGKGSSEFSWNRTDIDPMQMTQTLCLESPYGKNTVSVPRLGDYVGDLISGIIAVCYYLGLEWQQVEPGLSVLPQEKGRSTFLKGKNGVLILDDTYNANPESVVAMLNTICSLNMKQTIGVVGNLAELDEDLKETAGYIVENIPSNLTDLLLSGDTGKILSPKIQNRHPNLNVVYTDSIISLIEKTNNLAHKDAVIGVKGSRTSHLERVVYALGGRMTRCELGRCGKLMMCNQCEEL